MQSTGNQCPYTCDPGTTCSDNTCQTAAGTCSDRTRCVDACSNRCVSPETCVVSGGSASCKVACTPNTPCPANNRCEAGYCVADPCAVCDPTTQQCVQSPNGVSCVTDPCLSCSNTQTCVNGVCYNSCPAGTSCPSGSTCTNGACQPSTDPCGGQCGSGQVCVQAQGSQVGVCRSTCGSGANPCTGNTTCLNSVCSPDPCANTNCPAGSRCSNGACLCDPTTCVSPRVCRTTSGTNQVSLCVDLCAQVTCPEGSYCNFQDAQCYPRACPALVCPDGSQCTPTYSANGACNSCCPATTCSPNTCPAPNTCNSLGLCVCGQATCQPGTVCTASYQAGSTVASYTCASACLATVRSCPDGSVVHARSDCSFPSCPTTCSTPCPGGSCVNGVCVSPCSSSQNGFCPAGYECDPQLGCVTSNTCLNRLCPPNTRCDPATGSCLCSDAACPTGQICRQSSSGSGLACADPCSGVTCPGSQTCFASTNSPNGYTCACSANPTAGSAAICAQDPTTCTCVQPDPCQACADPTKCTSVNGVRVCDPCHNIQCNAGETCVLSSTGATCVGTPQDRCNPNPCRQNLFTNAAGFTTQVGTCSLDPASSLGYRCEYGSACDNIVCRNSAGQTGVCVQVNVQGTNTLAASCVYPDVCANVRCLEAGAFCVPDATAAGFSCVNPCVGAPCGSSPCTGVQSSTGSVSFQCNIPTPSDPCASQPCASGYDCVPSATTTVSGNNVATSGFTYSCVRKPSPCDRDPCGIFSSPPSCQNPAAGGQCCDTVSCAATTQPCAAGESLTSCCSCGAVAPTGNRPNEVSCIVSPTDPTQALCVNPCYNRPCDASAGETCQLDSTTNSGYRCVTAPTTCTNDCTQNLYCGRDPAGAALTPIKDANCRCQCSTAISGEPTNTVTVVIEAGVSTQDVQAIGEALTTQFCNTDGTVTCQIVVVTSANSDGSVTFTVQGVPASSSSNGAAGLTESSARQAIVASDPEGSNAGRPHLF